MDNDKTFVRDCTIGSVLPDYFGLDISGSHLSTADIADGLAMQNP